MVPWGCSGAALVVKYNLGHILSPPDREGGAAKDQGGKHGQGEGLKGSAVAPREECGEGSGSPTCKGGKARSPKRMKICYSSDEDDDSDDDSDGDGMDKMGKGKEKGSGPVLGEDGDPAEERERLPKIFYATRTHSQIAQVRHTLQKLCIGIFIVHTLFVDFPV